MESHVYPEPVCDAIISAYFGRVITAPERVRARAQTAYAIASTLAAGLLGFGLLGNLANVSRGGRLAGLCAFAAWMVAALAFISATSGPATLPTGAISTRQDWADAVLNDVATESKRIEFRLRIAKVLGGAAVVATAVTILIAISSWSSDLGRPVETVVSMDVATAVASVCGGGVDTKLNAEVKTVGGIGGLVVLYVVGRPDPDCALIVSRASVLATRTQ